MNMVGDDHIEGLNAIDEDEAALKKDLVVVAVDMSRKKRGNPIAKYFQR